MAVSHNTSGGQYAGVPSLGKYLGSDDQYQMDRESLIKNFRALRTKNRQNQFDLRDNYRLTRSRLGEEKQENLGSMEEDYAARGLFGSGVFAKDQNDFNLKYQDQFNDALTSYQRNRGQLRTDLSDAKRSRNQDLRNLRLDAIRRRAQKYGIQ